MPRISGLARERELNYFGVRLRSDLLLEGILRSTEIKSSIWALSSSGELGSAPTNLEGTFPLPACIS